MCSSMASKPRRTARSAAWQNAPLTRARPFSSSATGTGPPSAKGTSEGAEAGHGSSPAAERPTALPWALARGLASGMGELNGKARAGRRDAPRRIEHARERRFVGVGVEAETAVRDAAAALHAGRLDDHHASAGERQLHQVLQVPIRGRAIAGRVLAHGRDGDAVGQADRTQWQADRRGVARRGPCRSWGEGISAPRACHPAGAIAMGQFGMAVPHPARDLSLPGAAMLPSAACRSSLQPPPHSASTARAPS